MKLMLQNPEFNPAFKLEHQYKLFFIGSCFAETISAYFIDRKFVVGQNPFGILFNPVSIAHSLEHISSKKQYSQHEFYKHENGYSSWYHHSQFYKLSEFDLKNKLNEINDTNYTYLSDSNVAFVTLGTAWVYWHKELEMVVANNLKAPINLFERRLLEVDEINNSLTRIVDSLRKINRGIKIVFTISPVRHSKQGLVENNRSKARLLEAVHKARENDDSLVYFPSYELVMDVLRDYRFFKNDFVHPNRLATDYIWDYLQKHFIHENDYGLITELYNLKLATSHRIQNTTSISSRKFIDKQLTSIRSLKNAYPYLNLENERAYFENL